MPEARSDTALVLTMPRGESIDDWISRRLLDREATLLSAFCERFARVVLITHGDEADPAAALELEGPLGDAIRAAADGGGAGLWVLPWRIGATEGPGTKPLRERLEACLGPVPNVLIQTFEFDDGGIADRLIGDFERTNRRVRLVARGSELASRRLSLSIGPHAVEAIEAGMIEQEICRAARVVVGTTRAALDDLAWRMNIDPARTVVVSEVVHPRPPAPEPRDRGMLLAAGPLEPASRHELTIRALSRLGPAEREQTRLVIWGRGSLEPSLRELAESLGVRLEIEADGRYDRFCGLADRCGAFIETIVGSGRPIELLEAMNAGCGIIGLDSVEVSPIEHALSGLRVSPEPDAICYTAQALLTDPNWADLMGDAARRWVREQCSLDAALRGFDRAHGLALGEIEPGTDDDRLRKAG